VGLRELGESAVDQLGDGREERFFVGHKDRILQEVV
jgi:hypothetical protein